MDDTDAAAAQQGGGTSWPFQANCPQRYAGNYRDYASRGGLVRPREDVQGFVAGGVNRGDMARFYFLSLAFDQICREDIIGDFAELGVYRGNTATVIARMARRLGRTAYLFDTFEGFDRKDLQGVDAAVQPDAFGDTSLAAVRAAVGEANVAFMQGYFPDTAAGVPDDARFSLVHIDCDLYAPILSGLRYFYPRLVPGGFLIVHDYSSLCWAGAEKAIDEFFADKPEAVIPLPDGAGSAVIRKARAAGPDGNWLNRRRARVLQQDWVHVVNGGLGDLLGIGWCTPEAWGVWGTGDVHELHLVVPGGGAGVYRLDMASHVALLGARTSQQVDVAVAGRTLATWDYTAEANSGFRSVDIRVDGGRPDATEIVVQFRPRSVARPCDLEPGHPETRPLGVALHRIRFRKLDAPPG
ncbi:MAG: TylF/MycF/NovP-related O-methyltransferase [Acetobacteraceae bacterium]